MPDDQDQAARAKLDELSQQFGISTDDMIALASQFDITDTDQLAGVLGAAKYQGLTPSQFMAGHHSGQQVESGTNWSELLAGVDPRVARTAVSAGSDQANAYPELGTTAAQSLANLNPMQRQATTATPGLGLSEMPGAMWDNKLLTAAQLPQYGGFNLGGLARAALANTAFGSNTGLGVTDPGRDSWMDGTIYNTDPGLTGLAKQHGLRLGGYSDPTKLVDTMRSSIDARKEAMTQSGQYTPEQVEQWGNDELSRFNAMLGVEGGTEGLRQQQHDATTRAVAGTAPGQGTVNEAYNAGFTANTLTPAALARQQAQLFGGIPKAVGGAFRGAGSAWDWAKRSGPVAAATTAAPRPGMTAGGVLKGGLRNLAGAAGIAASLPTYLQAARNDMDLYDTAMDPNGEGGMGHRAATLGTGGLSLGMQVAGGEAAVPGAIRAGAAGGRAAMAGTELGKQFAQRTPWQAATRNPLKQLWRAGKAIPAALGAARAAGGAGTVAGAARGLGGFARGAAPAAMLGSWAVDAGANASAATRNLANFSGGGDETVRAENRALADNSGWTDGSAGGIAKGIAGAVFRPTTATREIAGAVDQNREMIRGNEDAAAEMASRQHVAPIRRLQRYRAQVAAAGQDTSAIDKQIQTVSQRIAAGPSNQSWQDVAKWQQGGWFTNRSQLPFNEQYAKMDAATRAKADEIIKGVSAGTVDPERARVALGLPAMQDWSPNDMRDPNKAAANQRWVVNQADVGTNRANPQWQISGQWQNPNIPKPQITPKPAPQQQQQAVPPPAPVQPAMRSLQPTANTPVAAARPVPTPQAPVPRLASRQPSWLPAYGAQ